MKIIKKILVLFTPYERLRATLLLFMILIMALLDMIGVASIVPFMIVLTNPSLIETNLILNSMFQASKIFGVENNQQFFFILGLLTFFFLVVTLSFKALTNYVQVRFIHMHEYILSKRLVEAYLHQSYSWFLNRHSADLGNVILSQVSEAVGSGIYQLMEVIAKGMVIISLITLLILFDPQIALIVGLSFSCVYACIFYFLYGFLNRIGKQRFKSNNLRFKTLLEVFGAVKQVKVGGLEQFYIKRFSDSARNFAQTQATSLVIGQLPRLILEVIAFGGIMLIILFLMMKENNFNQVIPLVSLYVFAGYRLMPALQQMYSSLTQLAFVGPAIDSLSNEIKNLNPLNLNQDQDALSFNKKITLKKIHYSYPNTLRTTLKDININIPAKNTIGLVGTTGSGKTTTVDIILGLLKPQKGTLEVDGQIITKQNSRAWQRCIGYVPQEIYLVDDTVEANIAFGVESKDVNRKAIVEASKIANLHQFVISELQEKYQTIIGERGVKLSGGQRQRIGIARALYRNPKVLILDEATSALDNQTEQAVMNAVNNMNKDITIIIVAHRLTTVKKCDMIFKFEKGEIVGQGTFNELINNSKNFSHNDPKNVDSQ